MAPRSVFSSRIEEQCSIAGLAAHREYCRKPRETKRILERHKEYRETENFDIPDVISEKSSLQKHNEC
jgi:hypothetical protein